MDEKDFDILIEKFWKGSATIAEKEALFNYLSTQDDQLREKLRRRFEQAQPTPLLDDTRRELLLQQLHQKINNETENTAPPGRTRIYKRLLSLAAAVFLIIGAGLVIRLYQPQPQQPRSTLLVMDSIKNQTAGMQLVTMPDQSLILLYPQSSIRFEKGFENRNIQLKGKAYFKVIHDDRRIFTVSTDDIITTDIGTEFEIDAEADRQVLVSLVEGAIKVGARPGSSFSMTDQLLKVGETIRINLVTGRFARYHPEQTRSHKSAARPARLVFTKTPLDEVFSQIAHRYNVRIRFNKEELRGLTFTGSVEPGDVLHNIINTICYMNDLKSICTEDACVISSR